MIASGNNHQPLSQQMRTHGSDRGSRFHGRHYCHAFTLADPRQASSDALLPEFRCSTRVPRSTGAGLTRSRLFHSSFARGGMSPSSMHPRSVRRLALPLLLERGATHLGSGAPFSLTTGGRSRRGGCVLFNGRQTRAGALPLCGRHISRAIRLTRHQIRARLTGARSQLSFSQHLVCQDTNAAEAHSPGPFVESRSNDRERDTPERPKSWKRQPVRTAP